MKCAAILKTGARKGEECGKKAKTEVDGRWVCGVHQKSITGQLTDKEPEIPEEFSDEIPEGLPVKEPKSWEELNSRKIPKWYSESDLGIIVHWGVYSVPAFQQHPKSKVKVDPKTGAVRVKGLCNGSEWYWRRLQYPGLYKTDTRDFHQENFPGMDYPDFAADFGVDLPKDWAKKWARLFRQAGANFVVLTAKHHDGYTLWPTEVPNLYNFEWSSERDLLGELAEAVRAEGMRFGLYYSWMDWNHPLYLLDKRENKKNPGSSRRFPQEVALPHLQELITKYQPDYFFFDGDWEQSPEYWHSREFLTWLFEDSPVRATVVVNDRLGKGTAGRHGTVKHFSDRFVPKKTPDFDWESIFTIGNSWAFNAEEGPEHFKSAEEVEDLFMEIGAKNGHVLLNVGPDANGRIRSEERKVLQYLGK